MMKKSLFFIALCLIFTISISFAEPEKKLPLRIFLLSFEQEPELNAKFDLIRVNKLISEVNLIWARWGIVWEITDVKNINLAKNIFSGLSEQETDRSLRLKLSTSMSKLSDFDSSSDSDSKVWTVAIFRQFPVKAGGVYAKERGAVFYSELSKLGEGSALILAHELGHALGLDHVGVSHNLMYGGRDRNIEEMQELTGEQVNIAHNQADKGPMRIPANAKGSQGMKKMRANPALGRKKQNIIRRLRRFDRNQDGIISRSEVPYKAYKAFDRLDLNRDSILVQEELSVNAI